jgi:hypothetical protein
MRYDFSPIRLAKKFERVKTYVMLMTRGNFLLFGVRILLVLWE